MIPEVPIASATLLMVGSEKDEILSINTALIKLLRARLDVKGCLISCLPAPTLYEAERELDDHPEIDVVYFFDRAGSDPTTGSYTTLLKSGPAFVAKTKTHPNRPWIYLGYRMGFLRKAVLQDGVHVREGPIEDVIRDRWACPPPRTTYIG